MSWRGSGNFRGSGSSPRRSSPPGSVFSGGSAGGPPLLYLIVGAVAVGVIGLIIMLSGVRIGGTAAQTAAQPAAAQPTAAPTVAPTAAPAAAPAATANIPTEPYGPALASGSGEAVTIGSDGDLLAFDQTRVEVPNGLVTLTFENNATAVQHNWVLVEGGDDAAAAVNTAAQAQVTRQTGASGALPPADTANFLAGTPMVNAGDSITVTFETPGTGTYLFICTFPGHYLAGMQGELVVN